MNYVKLRRPFRGKLGFYQPLRTGVAIPEEEKLPPGAIVLDREGGKPAKRVDEKGKLVSVEDDDTLAIAHADPVKPNATNIREAAKAELSKTLGAGEKDPGTIAEMAQVEAKAQADLFAAKSEPATDKAKAEAKK